MLDKDTQIKILLEGRGRAYDYACQTLGVDNMMHHSYGDVFTVSEAYIYEYIQKNGLPESEDTGRNSLKEGFHYYKEDSRWHTFFSDYGHKILPTLPSFLPLNDKIYHPLPTSLPIHIKYLQSGCTRLCRYHSFLKINDSHMLRKY